MSPLRLDLLLALFLAIIAVPALGHDMWLEPATFTPEIGAPVTVGLWIGHGGSADPFPRAEDRFLRFDAVTPDDASRPVPGADGAHPAGVLASVAPGTTAVVLTTTPAFSSLPGPRFHAYLEEEGLEHVAEERRDAGEADDPGRELYSRSLKTLLVAGGGRPEDRTTGLPLEMVIRDAERKDDAWRVEIQLLASGEPVAHALIDASGLGEDRLPVSARRTDEEGRVTFDLRPGAWKLGTVHMRRSDAKKAEWRSTWSALTFALPTHPTHPTGGTSP